MVIAAAGSVDHDAIVELAQRTLGDRPALEPAPDARARAGSPAGAVRFVRKDTEQVHVTLGGLGLQRGDDRRFAARVLDAIFGGLSSSRLFQAVREERGLAYSVYSFAGQYADTGQVGLYVGTRPDNLVEAMKVVNDELERLREQPATEAELVRARENVKARVVLGMESTGARMHRLGGSLLFDLPLLETDEVMERIDAVTMDDMRSLVDELWRPGALSAAGIGPDEDCVLLRGRRDRGRRAVGRVIRVAVAGAAGRMGSATCDAVEGAEDMELTGRADPTLGTSVIDVLGDADVLVDFTIPSQAVGNAREAAHAGVHVVIGTTGWDDGELREAVAGAPGKVFAAANFAIGAVLMMRFAAEASKHMQSAEIIEYHRPQKLDKPSGTAARTAAADARRRADPLRAAAGHHRRPGRDPRRRRARA